MEYKRNRLKELWWNRPWVYLPEVVRYMKKYPLGKDGIFKIWLRNCFYMNWQVCFEKKGGRNEAEVAAEIFEEIEKIGVIRKVIKDGEIIYDVTAEYDELKKKYTGDQP